jgi:hypothetical protein
MNMRTGKIQMIEMLKSFKVAKLEADDGKI